MTKKKKKRDRKTHHPVLSAVEWPQEEDEWMQAGKSEVKGVKQRVARAR